MCTRPFHHKVLFLTGPVRHRTSCLPSHSPSPPVLQSKLLFWRRPSLYRDLLCRHPTLLFFLEVLHSFFRCVLFAYSFATKPMIRKSFRIVLYFLFYWNAIINAYPTAKIILPPRSPEAVTTDHSCLFESKDPSCTPKSLLQRVPLAFLQSTPSMSSTGTSNASTPTSNPDSEGTLHSSVPVVAGSLAGLIAILAVVLTVIVVRRKKRLVESRATIHPPYLGRNRTAALASDDQSPVSPSSASGAANPFISPILTRPPTKMSGSRYHEYMTDDLELTRRDRDTKSSRRNRPEDDIEQGAVTTADSDGEHRHVVPPRQIQLNGHNPSTPYPTLQAESLFTGDREVHEKSPLPRTISSRSPVPTFPSPTLLEAVGGPAAHSTSPLSNGHKPSLTSAVSGAPPDKVWNPRGGTDQTGDLPPAYDDVR